MNYFTSKTAEQLTLVSISHAREGKAQGQPQRLLESFWGSFFAFKSFRKALCQKKLSHEFSRDSFFLFYRYRFCQVTWLIRI